MAFFGLFGKKSRPAQTTQLPRFTPEQQALQSTILSQIGPLLQQAQAPQQKFDFGPVEQQARTQFATQTVPSLAERFTAMGGGQRSSAFQGALGRAGSGLEENLAALKSQVGLQQQGMEQQRLQGLLSALLGAGLQPSFENIYTPRTPSQPGILEQGLSTGVGGLARMLPLLFM